MSTIGTQNLAYGLALLSAILFSGASVIFARQSDLYSSLWMNLWKNFVAFLCFGATSLGIFLLYGLPKIPLLALGQLLLSGFAGLSIGDYFLFRGYQRIGSARTLMVFSFSPLLLTVEGYLLFGQSLSVRQFYALLLMMACVWVLSFEKFRESGHWEWRGFLYAFLGVSLDNLGIVLSKEAFAQVEGLDAFTANFVRTAGAAVPILLFLRFRGHNIKGYLFGPKAQDRLQAFIAAFFGTFLSLALWLTALKIGHIGGLAGVGSFNPVSASLWEWLLLKKTPTIYLFLAFAFFFSGFFLLVTA